MTGETIVFRYTTSGLLFLFFGGATFTALSALIACRLLPGVVGGSFIEFCGYFGALFFGLCTLVAASRLISHRGPVVMLTPSGFFDARIAAEEIPWTSIQTLRRVLFRRQEFVLITVDPELERRLTLTRIARWSRGPNRMLGFDGFHTSAQALNVSFNQFHDLCDSYLQNARHDPRMGNLQQASLRSSKQEDIPR